MEFVTSSDLAFGDMVINFCDPEFVKQGWYGDHNNLSTQVYKIVSYALFANRLIIPSRYLLQKSITFKSASALSDLLEAGILVPDLREGYISFEGYLRDTNVNDEERLECARFLDEHSALVYSFDIAGQSDLYHERLLEDIRENGLLRLSIDPDDRLRERFKRFIDEFSQCKGSRRTFVNLGTRHLEGFHAELSEWAALRYYTTPAELESRCIRDFPLPISQKMRDYGLSCALRFIDPNEHGMTPEPMNTAHQVLLTLPHQMPDEELTKLSKAVQRVRNQVPAGAAKFSSLCEEGFKENMIESNALFKEALEAESSFNFKIRDRMLECLCGKVPSLIVQWTLGSFLGPASNLIEPMLKIPERLVGREYRRRTRPFTETAAELRTETHRILKNDT